MMLTLLNNRYRILRTLGDGGFGETYLAEDTQMPSGRRCVIKQLKPVKNNPQIYQLVQERFQREAAILEELGEKSVQIPKLYAYFSEAGQFYLVQEWIEGQTLTHKVQQEGVLSESAVKELLISLLPVLDYVHSKRIVHRDIKPDNIILRASDSKPVLIDFGAVKETMGTVVTLSGNRSHSIVIGTPGFMPSEQTAGRPVYSSDLYSLGLTAVYLLTGKFPQELQSDPQTGEILWRRYALSVSPTFAAVLDNAIQFHPRDRYSTAREMLDALRTGVTPIAPISSPQPTVASPPPVGASYQPPAVISHDPITTSPATATSSAASGLKDWQKAVITGSVVGAFVVAALVFTRPQTAPSSQPEPQQTRAKEQSSPQEETTPQQPSPEASPSPTQINEQSVQPPASSPPVLAQTPVPSQSQFSPSAPSISQQEVDLLSQNVPPSPSISKQEAVNLIQKWLQAKQVIFAPPYNRQSAADLTTGEKYSKTAGQDGSIDWLEKNKAYYKYGLQKIDSVGQFISKGNQATIEVRVTEEQTLYINGEIDRDRTGSGTLTVVYKLQFVEGRWKIASSQDAN